MLSSSIGTKSREVFDLIEFSKNCCIAILFLYTGMIMDFHQNEYEDMSDTKLHFD